MSSLRGVAGCDKLCDSLEDESQVTKVLAAAPLRPWPCSMLVSFLSSILLRLKGMFGEFGAVLLDLTSFVGNLDDESQVTRSSRQRSCFDPLHGPLQWPPLPPPGLAQSSSQSLAAFLLRLKRYV